MEAHQLGRCLTRIARLMKDDRDANFVEKNAAGQTVNRWLTTGFIPHQQHLAKPAI